MGGRKRAYIRVHHDVEGLTSGHMDRTNTPQVTIGNSGCKVSDKFEVEDHHPAQKQTRTLFVEFEAHAINMPGTPFILHHMEEIYLYISVIFLAIAYLYAYVMEPDAATFDGWLNVLTHVAALPAIMTESKLSVQVSLTTAVSVIYHIVQALAEDSDFYLPLMQFDVGMSVALIAHVLFIYMDAIPGVPITFLATGAAAFPEYNVGITGAIILFGYPVSTILTLRHPMQKIKWILIILQTISIVAYVMADTWTTYTLHPIWHVASLLSIYYFVLLHQFQEPHVVLHEVKVCNQLRY